MKKTTFLIVGKHAVLEALKNPSRKIERVFVTEDAQKKLNRENQNLNLKPNDSLLNFIQRLRDEAHRFAITAHRSRRSKSSIKSIFDDIKGIGPKRKKELLLHFGTIQKIKSASLDELKQVKTIPSKKLEELYEFFNG